MNKITEAIKYAFSTKTQFLTQDEIFFLKKVANQIILRRLSVPAITLLEAVKPLNYLGSQVMISLNPILSLVLNHTEYEKIVGLLEKRESIEQLIEFIEEEECQNKK